ncbi:hypothetical protein GBAR_LOCUS10602 [Geodia barretti]|uniref:Uncharacterized protein n=1 Tax=Geodia barretti TaxID=519541 RepID=A0AA35RTK6_GEOBA|nr:hypothetical protein GBAR_LOCUS10602 [Geodia barretti]
MIFLEEQRNFGYVDVLRKKSLRGLVAHNGDILKSLFTVDPVLIFDVIYLCPDEEFSTLCSIVPACLSLKWLSFQKVKMLKDFVLKWKSWLEKIGEKVLNEVNGRESVVATAYAALGLVWHLFSNLPGKLDFQLDVLKWSITILLYSLCHVEDLIANQEVVEVEVIGQAFQWCQLSLKSWIESTNVIGGSVFGGKSGRNSTEFKLWQSMLSTKPLRHKKISTDGQNVLNR